MTVCGSRFIGQQWMKFVKRTLLRAGRATVHSSLHHRFRCQESLIRLTWACLRFQGAQTDTRILHLLLSNSTSRTFEILWYRSISPLTTFKTSLNLDTSINKTTRDNSNLNSLGFITFEVGCDITDPALPPGAAENTKSEKLDSSTVVYIILYLILGLILTALIILVCMLQR